MDHRQRPTDKALCNEFLCHFIFPTKLKDMMRKCIIFYLEFDVEFVQEFNHSHL